MCLVGNLFSKIPVCEEIIKQAPNLGYVLPDDCGHVKLDCQMYCMMNLYQIKFTFLRETLNGSLTKQANRNRRKICANLD